MGMESEMKSPSGMRKFMKAKFLVPGGIAVVVVLGIILVWFQPQALFFDKTVNEPAPAGMSMDKMTDDKMTDDKMTDDKMTDDKMTDDKMTDDKMTDDKMTDDKMMDEAMMSMSGRFQSLKYETKGTALLTKAGDGNYYLRFEDFSTQNGPDLRVYLSAAPAGSPEGTYDDEFVDLGELKGNKGNQNYQVPDGTDLSKYKSVVIWCKRFTQGFGVASLNGK